MAKEKYIVRIKTEMAEILVQTKLPLDKNSKYIVSSFMHSLVADLIFYHKDKAKYTEKIAPKRLAFEKELLMLF